jgi:hypothetical protein
VSASTEHHQALAFWWEVAGNDFAQLRDGRKMPEVRQELLTGKVGVTPLLNEQPAS